MDSINTNEGNDSQNIAAKGAALLLVIGEPFTEEHKNLILEDVTKGFKSWDTETTGIDINDELAQVANKADLGEEGPEGERVIRNNSDSLAVEILVNPQTQTVKNAVKQFLCVPTKHKHLVYTGHVLQGSGAWILQDDTYSFSNFAKAFVDSDVSKALKLQEGCSLNISTEGEGEWTNSNINKSDISNTLKVKLNPGEKLDNLHGVIQFTAYVSNFVKVRMLSDLLQSSDVVGNIRFTRPTLYIFPGCQGDSALFGISGFNLLVNGGYSRKACFWDFTRHLDRIDAALMTHLGTDNLFGLSSVLQRKSIENVHPEIGGIFVNASDKLKALPQAEDNKKSGLTVNLAEEGNKLIQYAKQIGQLPHPCSRTSSGSTVEPINLYHKIGIGSLDMYILNPVTDSKEMKEFYQQWNQNVAQFGVNQHLPLPNMLSVCALLVWRPSDPKDNITRVFFPGNAPQHKVLEGLEKLKTLDILKHPVCNKESLTAKPAKKPASANRAPSRPKVSPAATPKEEAPKKEVPPRASSTPKSKPASFAPKAKKEDVNKKASKSAPKEEKTDKTKSQSSSPSKASNKGSTPSTPKLLASPVKADKEIKLKKEPESAKKKKEEAPLVPELASNTEVANGHVDSSVDPPGFSNDLIEPTSVTDEQSARVPEPMEMAKDAGIVMDKNKMIELGIYDDEYDIEGDLNAQANQVEETPQTFGGMTESMHEDYMGDMNAKNTMQSSFHGDLMTGSMHESMYDNKQPFDDPHYGMNDHSAIDEMTTPEDETSEEIQPQALPEPMAYAPGSYSQEPDVIPSMQIKEEPIATHEAEPLQQTQQEPDLLPLKQEGDEISASHGMGEESTAPVEDKVPVELETPDEVENTFPEDEGFSQPQPEEVQEKDVIEQNEKDLSTLDEYQHPVEEIVEPTKHAEVETQLTKDDEEMPEAKDDEHVKIEPEQDETTDEASEDKHAQLIPDTTLQNDGIMGIADDKNAETELDPVNKEEEISLPEDKQDDIDHLKSLQDQNEGIIDFAEDKFADSDPEDAEPKVAQLEDLVAVNEQAAEQVVQEDDIIAMNEKPSEFQPELASNVMEADFGEKGDLIDENLIPPVGFQQDDNASPDQLEKDFQQDEQMFSSERFQEDETAVGVQMSEAPGNTDLDTEPYQPETSDLPMKSGEDFGSISEATPKTDDLLQTPDDDLDKEQNIDLSPDMPADQEGSVTPEDLVERPKSPEPLELEQEQSASNPLTDNASAGHMDPFDERELSPAEAERAEAEGEIIPNDFRGEQPESLHFEQTGAINDQHDYRPETPESGDRADTPDSQNRDSLEREAALESEDMQQQQVSEEQNREDSIERQVDQRESSERESEPRDSIERESDHGNQGPVSSDDQRDSIERSYEEEEEETEDSEEDEESSSFEQEENTDERCLIQDSTSEQVEGHNSKVMDPDSLAAPFDSLMDQPSDNLLTPESETSHGGQLGYHQIGEQDDVDSVEDEKDGMAACKAQSAHPFGQDFEEFGVPTSQMAYPSSNPFAPTEERLINPLVGFSQPPPPEEDSSPEDEFRSGRGPSDFDPLAEWGQPMGLPSPPPPEEKAATNGPDSGKKPPRPKSATKTADSKKSAMDARKAPAANGIKKTEAKRPLSAPKKSALTKPAAPKASNCEPEKSKTSRPGSATGGLNTSRASANTSRLSLGGSKSATTKTRPASAPDAKSKEKSSNESLSKPKPNGLRKPASSAKTAPTVKMPPLPPFTAFYVDLTYIPTHGNPSYSDTDFFKRVRARHYVLSALSPDPQILDCLLEAKKTWDDKELPVTVIPTYDNEALRLWMTLNKEKLAAGNVEIAPSASRCTIQLQDHETSSSAYRLEF